MEADAKEVHLAVGQLVGGLGPHQEQIPVVPALPAGELLVEVVWVAAVDELRSESDVGARTLSFRDLH